MFYNSDFDNLTFDYLTSPTPMTRERLIRAGHAVVYSLLNSLVRHISEYGASVISQHERERIKAYDWPETVFQPLLLPAHQVISQIGEPARYQLCKAMQQSDRRIHKVAALVLALQATENAPSVRTITEIRNDFWNANIKDTTVVMLLTFVLAGGGDTSSQQAIEQNARDNGMSLEQWITKTMDTAILELLGWSEEVLR